MPLILLSPHKASVSGMIWVERAAGLTDSQRRVVNYIADRGKINMTSAMKLVEKNVLAPMAESRLLQTVSRYQRDSSTNFVFVENTDKPQPVN